MSPPLSFKRNIYILPFDQYVWFSVVGLMLIIIPAMYYAGKFENKVEKKYVIFQTNGSKYYLQKNNYSWGEITMLSISSICMQGNNAGVFGKVQ